MFQAPGGSWRAGVDANSRLLDVALYVRDACGLGVPADPSVPPRLLDEVVDHTADLAVENRRAAGSQWLSWWHRILVIEGARELGTLELPATGIDRLQSLAAAQEAILDWPELGVLAHLPELQEAVRVSYEDASRWYSRKVLNAARGSARGRLFRNAEALVQHLDVRPEQFRAAVIAVDVVEDWFRVVAPGVLLCSHSVLADLERFSGVVEETFMSGLEAPEVPLPTHQRRRPWPPSALREPLVLWSGPDLSLVCERVIAYRDGFEVELRRTGGGTPTRPAGGTARAEDPWGRPDKFADLEIELGFADGRRTQLSNLTDPDKAGPITLSRFWRKNATVDTLWLWAMPLPPDGEVRLSATWATYGIRSATVSLEGSTIRPQQS